METNERMKACNIKEYLSEDIAYDMKEFSTHNVLNTGFSNLDTIAPLYSGLYIIGAISSLGKTTFVNQLSDQLAEQGHHIIYFSLEQTTLELVSKSLTRLISRKDIATPITALKIRQGYRNDKVTDAIDEYSNFADKITIVEGSFSITADDIISYVNSYVKKYRVKPVVIVDYLQAIQGDTRLSAKDLTDSSLRKLKYLQTSHNITIIAISSLNRQNYLATIDFESYKESGGIEYTADVIWGLQLEVLNDSIFDTQGRVNEKRQRVKGAKAEIPRKIELVCLKNRFGISSYSCVFDYYPHLEYFIPIF